MSAVNATVLGTASSAMSVAIEAELDGLWRFALRLASNPEDASELVRRTCICAIEQQSQYSSRTKLCNWLKKIQHGIWHNEIRSRKARVYDCLHAPQSATETYTGCTHTNDGAVHSGSEKSDAAERGAVRVSAQQVHRAINQLPQAHRLAIILIDVERCTYEEAAYILNVPEGILMSRYAKARIAIGRRRACAA